MKPLPPILTQQGGSCQAYASVQALLAQGIYYDPERLYAESVIFNYGREPNTKVVLDYLLSKDTVLGYTKQWVGQRGAWLPIGMIYAWFYRLEWQIRVAKNVCDYAHGGLLSIRVDDSVRGNGVITEKMLKEGNDHLVYLYDYDDDKKRFILVNSWGTDYGDHTGCLYLPYELTRNVLQLVTLDN